MFVNCWWYLWKKTKKRAKTSGRISITTYSKKVFHKCFSSILYKKKKELFEGVHVINKKVSFTHPPSCICPHFLRIHHDYFLTITVSFRNYKQKVVISLFNEDSSKSIFFMLNMAFDVLLSTVFVKLEFLVSCNIKITKTSRSVYFFIKA